VESAICFAARYERHSARFHQADCHANTPHRACSPHHPAAHRLERLHDHGLVLHLRFREVPLWQVILASWGLAFVEYCLAVPANRYGSYVYSAAQLKTIQEVITLSVFAVFSVVYLQQPITWNQVMGFALIAGGAFFVFCAPI
jgi:uncharacterized protein